MVCQQFYWLSFDKGPKSCTSGFETDSGCIAPGDVGSTKDEESLNSCMWCCSDLAGDDTRDPDPGVVGGGGDHRSPGAPGDAGGAPAEAHRSPGQERPQARDSQRAHVKWQRGQSGQESGHHFSHERLEWFCMVYWTVEVKIRLISESCFTKTGGKSCLILSSNF